MRGPGNMVLATGVLVLFLSFLSSVEKGNIEIHVKFTPWSLVP
jgi:hypothetical protein